MEERTGVVMDIRIPPFMSRMMVITGNIHGTSPATKLTRDKSRKIINKNTLKNFNTTSVKYSSESEDSSSPMEV